jgi:hypothetical protein
VLVPASRLATVIEIDAWLLRTDKSLPRLKLPQYEGGPLVEDALVDRVAYFDSIMMGCTPIVVV